MGIAAVFPFPALKLEAFIVGRPDWLKKTVFASLILFITTAGGMLLFKGKMVLRNRELFSDIDYRSGMLPQNQKITVYPQTLVFDWYLVAYMQRFLKASLTVAVGNRYCLVDGSAGNVVPPGYRPLSAKKHQRYFLCINDRSDEKLLNK
jgi:hypothetical protein